MNGAAQGVGGGRDPAGRPAVGPGVTGELVILQCVKDNKAVPEPRRPWRRFPAPEGSITTMVTKSAAPASAPETPASTLGTSAADELRKTVRRALGALFKNFIEQLPQALVVSGQGLSGGQPGGFHDLARSVPDNQRRWLETFIQQVDGHLIGDVNARKSEASPTTPEESFVLANLELRAEEMHQNLIAQLDARLERVRQNVYIPIHAKALAPAGLCRALQDTADALEWPHSQRRVLFEKFDDLVVHELQHLYRSLLDALARINVAAERSAAATAPAAAPAPVSTPTPSEAPAAARATAPVAGTAAPVRVPPAPVPPPAARQPAPPAAPMPVSAPARPAVLAFDVETGPLPPLRIPFKPDRLDGSTLTMLQSVASNDTGSVYSDGTLAAELLAISNHQPVRDLPPAQTQVPMQRLNLAGHYLSEAIADPLIPPELKQQHETMRFPLVKSAIADETFFTAVTHPLRSLVNEMMLKSATSRVTGSSETRRIAELLQQVLVQFDLAPSFVREAMLTAKPLDPAQMKVFEDMQRQQAQQRRDSVINEAKRIVAHEIEQTTFSLSVPDAVTAFFNKYWGPVLVKRLLQHGSEHPIWKEGVGMMEALADQVERRDPSQPPPPEWKALLQRFVHAMSAAGTSPEKIHECINSLEAARRTPPFEI